MIDVARSLGSTDAISTWFWKHDLNINNKREV